MDDSYEEQNEQRWVTVIPYSDKNCYACYDQETGQYSFLATKAQDDDQEQYGEQASMDVIAGLYPNATTILVDGLGQYLVLQPYKRIVFRLPGVPKSKKDLKGIPKPILSKMCAITMTWVVGDDWTPPLDYNSAQTLSTHLFEFDGDVLGMKPIEEGLDDETLEAYRADVREWANKPKTSRKRKAANSAAAAYETDPDETEGDEYPYQEALPVQQLAQPEALPVPQQAQPEALPVQQLAQPVPQQALPAPQIVVKAEFVGVEVKTEEMQTEAKIEKITVKTEPADDRVSTILADRLCKKRIQAATKLTAAVRRYFKARDFKAVTTLISAARCFKARQVVRHMKAYDKIIGEVLTELVPEVVLTSATANFMSIASQCIQANPELKTLASETIIPQMTDLFSPENARKRQKVEVIILDD